MNGENINARARKIGNRAALLGSTAALMVSAGALAPNSAEAAGPQRQNHAGFIFETDITQHSHKPDGLIRLLEDSLEADALVVASGVALLGALIRFS